jgi:hypothetical protein
MHTVDRDDDVENREIAAADYEPAGKPGQLAPVHTEIQNESLHDSELASDPVGTDSGDPKVTACRIERQHTPVHVDHRILGKQRIAL